MKICVDGNIASGKSTVIRALSPELRALAECSEEPVTEWGELLQLYYADQKKWALALNTKVLLTFARHKTSPGISIVERSPLTTKDVFVQLARLDASMNAAEINVFDDLYDTLGWQPDVLVFVDTPASVCHDRMNERDRSAERGLPVEYLRRVEFYYEKMLRAFPGRVVRINGLQSAECVAREVEAAIWTEIDKLNP